MEASRVLTDRCRKLTKISRVSTISSIVTAFVVAWWINLPIINSISWTDSKNLEIYHRRCSSETNFSQMTLSVGVTTWHVHWWNCQACISSAAWAEARLDRKHTDSLPMYADVHHLRYRRIAASSLSHHRDTIRIVSYTHKPKWHSILLCSSWSERQLHQSRSDVVEMIEPKKRSPHDEHRRWVMVSWHIDCAPSEPIHRLGYMKMRGSSPDRFTWEQVSK